jgi:hypothetical protein
MPHPFFAVSHAAWLFDGGWGSGRLDAGTTSRNRCLRSCGDLWIVDSLTGVQRKLIATNTRLREVQQ